MFTWLYKHVETENLFENMENVFCHNWPLLKESVHSLSGLERRGKTQ